MHLVVIHPFADYARGDKITDPDKISEITEVRDGVAHDNVRHVVKSSDPIIKASDPA
jgi:hypothetical protein